MITAVCEQGSAEWLEVRTGIPTTSEFDRIVTSKGEATSSAARNRYLHEKVGERVGGTVQVHFVGAAAERGTNLEPKAREWYAAETDQDVEQVGFIYRDAQRRCGCSPDGLVGGQGGIEIKCPLRPQMISALLRKACPTEYLVQAQGGLWVTGRKWWDVIVYTEDYGIPNRIWRVTRSDVIFAGFAKHIPAFCDDIDTLAASIERLKT